MDVALESAPEECPQELEDPGRVAVEVPGVDRLVILVDEDDDLLPVVGMKIVG